MKISKIAVFGFFVIVFTLVSWDVLVWFRWSIENDTVAFLHVGGAVLVLVVLFGKLGAWAEELVEVFYRGKK